MRELKNLIVLMVFAFLGVATVMAATLRGRAFDDSGEALIQASVKVLAKADSALVKGAVTGNSGRFTIENVKPGKYILEVSYVGYAAQYKNFTVSTSDETVNLGDFKLSESSYVLGEATVVGIRTPIKVMEDTIEFSAESYKTQPNAVVEDLLKRLPGVEVDSEGKITANGKEVTKILLDGKEFFSDDPTVASRNLPVEMVEKLQVVDRKSDLARLTGVDDGEDETVINLTVKKGMKNGWFGNAEAGYGTDNRYRGNFTVNRFWDNNQLTILGAANNINEPGFADGASGRFRRFGGANGITAAQSLGLNFNVGKSEIFRVGGDVMYSHTDRDTRTSSLRTYLIPGSMSSQDSESASRDKGHNIRGDFRIQWKPDSFNTFDFRPNISLNYNDSKSNSTSQTLGGGSGSEIITNSINQSTSKGHSFELGGRLIYNHNFRQKRGRSFSVFANYKLSNVYEDANTYSYNRFFLLEEDPLDVYDQYADNHTWSNNLSVRLSWTEPLGNVAKGNFLTFAYRVGYTWNNADKYTYDHPVVYDPADPEGFNVQDELVFNTDLSNSFRNNFFSQDIRVGYKKVSKTGTLDAGISFVPSTSQSINLINSDKSIPLRKVFNVAPFLRYNYKMGKNRSLNMNYNGRSTQPSMTQLQPVADMSDPLRIVIGNPELNPTFTHSLRLRFQDFSPEAQRSIMTMLDAQLAQNSIVSKTTYNTETGGQVTEYANVNGVWNVRAMNMFSMPFTNKEFTFNNNLFVMYSNNIGFNNGVRNRSGNVMVGESFGIAWRPSSAEIELRPNYNLQSVHNSLAGVANSTVHTYGGSLYGTYYTPFGVVLSTDLNYAATKGYAAGYDTRTWMWNASLSYQFLRDRNATVTLKGYDILGQRSNVRRTVTANYMDDARYNSLTRYVMLSISYRFNTFGKGNEPKDRNEDSRRFRGPGGPGGPGGPPPGGGPR